MSDPLHVPPSEAPTIQPPGPGEGWSPHRATVPGDLGETMPGQASSVVATGHPSTTDMWFRPGSIVAETFRVERELGRGAMGVVVLANHLALDRLVALKVHRARDPADVSRLAREAKAMAKVRHPNVVGIYDVRESEGTLFIAMEYIEGQNARRWLARSEVAWRQRLDVCVQAAQGLQAAHEAGLVHRDFKPENILIGADGRVLVADFGLARAPGAVPIDPATPSPGVDAQLTAVGQVTGTPAYMSPEQWSGGPVDARSDVFALSVVIYEALYGRRPFRGDTPSDLLFAITRGMVLDPPHDSDVPKGVFEVLRRGMAVDPEYRFGSVAMLLGALRSATSSAGRTGIALAFGLAIAVFGALGGAAWVLRSQSDASAATSRAQRQARNMQPAIVVPPVAEIELRPKPKPSPSAEPPQTAAPGSGVSPSLVDDRDAEIEAAQLTLEALSEKAMQGLASPEQVIEATRELHALLRTSRDHAFVLTPWDGTSTFVCAMGERVELRDVSAKLDTTAIEVELGCGLKLVDVDIEAPVAISGQAVDRIVIEGGTFDVSHKGIDVQMAQVDIRDLKIKGDPVVGAAFGMHTVGTIEDSSFAGLTALRTGMHAKLDVRGGRIAGKTAIDVGMAGYVRLHETEVEGATKRAHDGRVERD